MSYSGKPTGCGAAFALVFVVIGIAGTFAGNVGMGLVFLVIIAPISFFIMRWSVGTSEQKKNAAKAEVTRSGHPPNPTFTYASTSGYMPTSELEEYLSFRKSKVLDRHFELTEQLDNAPKSRQESVAEELIKMSVDARSEFLRIYPESPLPSHRGFYRLAVNYERDKKFEDAITICRVAITQEWAGDWEKRIERCESKLEKMIIDPKATGRISDGW